MSIEPVVDKMSIDPVVDTTSIESIVDKMSVEPIVDKMSIDDVVYMIADDPVTVVYKMPIDPFDDKMSLDPVGDNEDAGDYALPDFEDVRNLSELALCIKPTQLSVLVGPAKPVRNYLIPTEELEKAARG